jgi:hypothetical protein
MNIGHYTDCNDGGIRGFLQTLQKHARIAPRLGHDRVFPNPLQFMSFYAVQSGYW